MSKGKRRKPQPQRNNKTSRPYRVTWAQAFRDVTNKAMARGQLLPIALLFITLLLIYKLPNGEVATLLDKLLDMLNQGEMWAYVLLVIICIGWYKHAKMMRKQFSAEYKRIGQEKSKIQRLASGIDFSTSDKR